MLLKPVVIIEAAEPAFTPDITTERAAPLLFWIVSILALASVITVVQRFVYVYQVTEGAVAPEAPKGP